jgi:hypothetical protein
MVRRRHPNSTTKEIPNLGIYMKKILFRFLAKSYWMRNFLLDRGIDMRDLPMSWEDQKELRIPNNSEWRGILRKEAKEKKERVNFINASVYITRNRQVIVSGVTQNPNSFDVDKGSGVL